MILTYACSKCKSVLFTGNLKSLLERRHKDSPPFIEMTCPECKHVNQLTYDESAELSKSRHRQNPLPLGDTVE
jgi:phage FluMu protein Com